MRSTGVVNVRFIDLSDQILEERREDARSTWEYQAGKTVKIKNRVYVIICAETNLWGRVVTVA